MECGLSRGLRKRLHSKYGPYISLSLFHPSDSDYSPSNPLYKHIFLSVHICTHRPLMALPPATIFLNQCTTRSSFLGSFPGFQCVFVCCIEGFVFLELVVLQTNSTEACMVHISALRSSDFVYKGFCRAGS